MAADEFGSLNLLVNNIGVAGPTKPCEELTIDKFLGTVGTNLGSLFATTKAAIPLLGEGADGRVVNLSSMSGKRPPEGRTPCTTSKMSVIGFTRTLVSELADDGVTANAVCPESVAGERLDAVIESQTANQERSFEDVQAEFRDVSPMN